MIKKIKTLQRIIDNGVMGVIRGDSLEQALKIAECCIESKLIVLEMAFTSPLNHRAMETLSIKYGDKILLGAGTVLDGETARIAILNGATYIVGPNFDSGVAKVCNRYQIPYIAGCMTLSEVVVALEHGVSIIKAFPGDMLGTNFIKNLKGQLPEVSVIPTGGVSLENMKDWFKAGAVAVGIGSALTSSLKKDPNDYESVGKNASAYLEKYQQIKKEILS